MYFGGQIMIIYSELTGRKYNTVEECVEAERKLKEQIEKEKEARRQERQKLDSDIYETYKALVNGWRNYINLLERAEYDVSSLEDKAILFVEIINDAERQKEKNTRS
jgi:hypothetical protein